MISIIFFRFNEKPSLINFFAISGVIDTLRSELKFSEIEPILIIFLIFKEERLPLKPILKQHL